MKSFISSKKQSRCQLSRALMETPPQMSPCFSAKEANDLIKSGFGRRARPGGRGSPSPRTVKSALVYSVFGAGRRPSAKVILVPSGRPGRRDLFGLMTHRGISAPDVTHVLPPKPITCFLVDPRTANVGADCVLGARARRWGKIVCAAKKRTRCEELHSLWWTDTCASSAVTKLKQLAGQRDWGLLFSVTITHAFFRSWPC